jgi:hypothetical protein
MTHFVKGRTGQDRKNRTGQDRTGQTGQDRTDLGGEVLEDGGAVDSGGGAHSSMAGRPALQVTMDPDHKKRSTFVSSSSSVKISVSDPDSLNFGSSMLTEKVPIRLRGI